MNVMDEIRALIKKVAENNRLLLNIRRTGGNGGGGEANTASNVGSAGVGLFDAKVGVDLQFRKANPKTSRVDITLDAPNKKVDFDIDPSQVDIDDLGDVVAGAPANNDVLTFVSAVSEWQPKSLGALGAGAVNLFAYRKSGKYYSMEVRAYAMTTTWLTYDILYAMPFVVPVQQSFDRIGINCNSGAANSVGRLGLYDDTGSVYPDNLIHGTAELDFSSSGDKEETISETLNPGLYWLAILIGTANPSVRCFYSTEHMFPVLGHSGYADLLPDIIYRGAQAYGAMPDPFPSGISEVDNQQPPAVMLRVA